MASSRQTAAEPTGGFSILPPSTSGSLRPQSQRFASVVGGQYRKASTVSSISAATAVSATKSRPVNPSNLSCLRQADVRESPSFRRVGSNRASRTSRTSRTSVATGYTVLEGQDGSLRLGCMLGMLRELLSAHETKVALQLVEDFASKRPAMYTLSASAEDFVQDIQSFTDNVLIGSTNPLDEPIRIIQSFVSQTTDHQIAGSCRPGSRLASRESLSHGPAGLPFSLRTKSGGKQPALSPPQSEDNSPRAPSKATVGEQAEVPGVQSDLFSNTDSQPQIPEHVSEDAASFSLNGAAGKTYDIDHDLNGLDSIEDVIDLDDVSLEQAAFLATKSDRFVCHPNHKARTFLDLVVLGLILMECVALPLSLSFAITLPQAMNGLSLAMFSVDMVMSFTTGFYYRDLLIMKRRRIVKNYVQTWFFLDVTSLFPWEAVFKAASISGGSGESGGTRTTFVRILKLGKLLRVLRLLRLAKITALIKRLQTVGFLPADLNNLKFGVAVAKMFFIFGLLSHWAACMWGWIGDPANVGPSSLEGAPPHSIVTCTMGGPCEEGIQGSPWRYRYGLGNYHAMIEYFVALQFTAGLITGGDTPLQASEPIERLFSILVMFCSVCVISVVVGEILLIMNRRAEARMAFDELTSQAREFMTSRKVATQVQVRVFRYMETQHMIRNGRSSSNRDFMVELSSELQKELIEQLNRSLLVQHPFFSKFQDNKAAFQQLCLDASPVIFAATENLVEQGDPAVSAHFIVVGKVRVEKTDGHVIYLKPPSWIGDVCLFCETLRSATVTAVITSETLMLHKSAVSEVVDAYPDVKAHFDTFKEQIEENKMDALMCPICHDFGHSANTCPTVGVDQKHSKKKSLPTGQRSRATEVFSNIFASRSSSGGRLS